MYVLTTAAAYSQDIACTPSYRGAKQENLSIRCCLSNSKEMQMTGEGWILNMQHLTDLMSFVFVLLNQAAVSG